MEQKEYPVGSRFQVNGQWYEVKPCIGDIVCTDCSFNSKGAKICECRKPDYIPDCVAPFRKDNANVYYVAIDPPTDTLDTGMLSRKIGSFFYDEGVKLQVCDANVNGRIYTCTKYCYYSQFALCSRYIRTHGLCTKYTRSDGKNVYFKEVKDEVKQINPDNRQQAN